MEEDAKCANYKIHVYDTLFQYLQGTCMKNGRHKLNICLKINK